jgi:hypothetical protein
MIIGSTNRGWRASPDTEGEEVLRRGVFIPVNLIGLVTVTLGEEIAAAHPGPC